MLNKNELLSQFSPTIFVRILHRPSRSSTFTFTKRTLISDSDHFNFHFASKYIMNLFGEIFLLHSQPNTSHTIFNPYSCLSQIGKGHSTEETSIIKQVDVLTSTRSINFRIILAINLNLSHTSKTKENIKNSYTYRNLCCWFYLSFMGLYQQNEDEFLRTRKSIQKYIFPKSYRLRHRHYVIFV